MSDERKETRGGGKGRGGRTGLAGPALAGALLEQSANFLNDTQILL